MNLADLLPIVGIFAVMYFLVLRPQMREKSDHEKFVQALVRGDRVVTASGVHGVIAHVGTDTVQLEIAEKTKITVDKSTIARKAGDPKPADDAAKS